MYARVIGQSIKLIKLISLISIWHCPHVPMLLQLSNHMLARSICSDNGYHAVTAWLKLPEQQTRELIAGAVIEHLGSVNSCQHQYMCSFK